MASAESSTHYFKRENHSVKVLNILKVYYDQNVMCDVVIIAEIDGTKVFANRNVISSCSKYFLDLFTKEKEAKEATVKGVPGSSLKDLMDYCYTGVVGIRKDNVKTLLDAAYHLQMDDVFEACQDYLVHHLDSSYSLEVAQIAEKHGFQDAQRKAEAFTHKHFMEVCQTKEFSQLKIEQLCRIIASDDLVVDSEQDVFNSCVSWVNVDRVDREKYFHQLLAVVRLPLLPPRFITEHLRSHFLCKSSESRELIFEAMAWHLNPFKTVLLNTQPRTSNTTTDISSSDGDLSSSDGDLSSSDGDLSSSDDVLVAIKKEQSKLVVQWYNNNANEWTDWKLPVELPDQRRFVCDMLGDSLLIVGEKDSSNPGTVTSYNFKSETLTAQKPLNTPRQYMGCAVLDGYVYIVGGWVGFNNLNTVERWDPKVQTWTNMTSMSMKRNGVGVAVLGKYLYAVGGYSGSYENSVERYDPNTNKWTSVAAMNTARYFPGVAAANGHLYAVGGLTDGFTWTSTVERFDPVANKWTMICSLGSARNEISCAFLGNLMAVGGYGDDKKWRPTVEEYDIETNKWTLKKPWSGTPNLTRLVKIPKIYLPV